MSVNKCKSQTFPVDIHEWIIRKTQSENTHAQPHAEGGAG